MKDLVITLALIAATVAVICLIRLLTLSFREVCRRPRAALRLYFDSDCECIEYILGRIYSSSAMKELELSVTVIDCVATEDSRRWLYELRKKIGKDFLIITEEESARESDCRDHQGDG